MIIPSPSRVLTSPNGRRYKVTRRFHVHETGPSSEVGVRRAHKVLQQCENDWAKHRLRCQVFCSFPGTLEVRFEKALHKYNMTQHKGSRRYFYPHLSTEAMPRWRTGSKSSFLSDLTKTLSQLGLVLTKVELKNFY
jgi:hypothetical protein